MTGAEQSGGSGPEHPLLRVVRGEPTPEELAALTVVLATQASAGSEQTPQDPGSRWRDRRYLMRRPLHPGPGGWRASAR